MRFLKAGFFLAAPCTLPNIYTYTSTIPIHTDIQYNLFMQHISTPISQYITSATIKQPISKLPSYEYILKHVKNTKQT